MYIRQDEWKIKEEEAFHKIFGLIHKSCKNDARHFEIRFIFFFIFRRTHVHFSLCIGALNVDVHFMGEGEGYDENRAEAIRSRFCSRYIGTKVAERASWPSQSDYIVGSETNLMRLDKKL